MPDWVTVTLYFKDEETAAKVFNENQRNGRFTFESIIPYPRNKQEVHPKYHIKNNKNLIPDERFPWLDYYTWCDDHWGTKSDCDPDVKIDKNKIIMKTMWNPPLGIILELSKKYEVTYTAEE